MTKKQNFIVTFILICVNCVMALFIPNIGDAMTLVGSTINPVIGFVLPVCFYWKINEDKRILTMGKMKGILVVIVIIIVSILSLISFFSDLFSRDEEGKTCLD
mmetsp:Transcript_16588/g.28242  ORF Transcript_16588/g.28242 Transcript_16588/m.28242 type:complete len:103 (+) Transcript_16588:1277-1585(+)